MNFIEKCVSLAMSLASRGFTNKKVETTGKQLRGLSCFGNEDIAPCPHLLKSKNFDSHYCGACGCGDTPFTQLTLNGSVYSKLDYPHLACPLEMPGFSNYVPASPKEVSERSRKSQIEVYDILKLQNISVSNPDPSDVEYQVFDKISKIAQSKNSK
jgi:hypothetical protein